MKLNDSKLFNLENLTIRLYQDQDDLAQINLLLRNAYRPLADAGMRYAASHEDEAATLRNIQKSECHLIFLNQSSLHQERLVGCVLLRLPKDFLKWGSVAKSAKWYQRPDVANFGRFAVATDLQGKGVGSFLLDAIERRAKSLGCQFLALDTAESATHLISMYEKRGYVFIEHHQWDITNYRSVIMSKRLND